MTHVNGIWVVFFQENFEVIRSFVFFQLCQYLQARNPNVPGIVNKLSAPAARDLGPARKFWRAVRSEFNRTGKGSLFYDIYSGDPLDDAFSIDHFLPWSFVAHDLLWNLTPVSEPTNSKKGDALPSANVYLPRLSTLHREAVLVMKSRPRMLEDYANWFMADVERISSMPEEQFFQQYRRLSSHSSRLPTTKVFEPTGSYCDPKNTTTARMLVGTIKGRHALAVASIPYSQFAVNFEIRVTALIA